MRACSGRTGTGLLPARAQRAGAVQFNFMRAYKTPRCAHSLLLDMLGGETWNTSISVGSGNNRWAADSDSNFTVHRKNPL